MTPLRKKIWKKYQKKINYIEILDKMPSISKFPKLNFKISRKEIEKLIEDKIIDRDDLTISKNISDTYQNGAIELSTLEKILYSIIWKNGDLGKEHHVISGILGEDHSGEYGIVFHEFGRYISNAKRHILDQHTLRCFTVSSAQEHNDEEISIARSISKINNDSYSKKSINDYNNYIVKLEKNDRILNKEGFYYQLDRLLFGAGKPVKLI